MAEKTWQFDINRAYTPNASVSTVAADLCKYVLWYYKAFLTGQVGGATQGLWTLVGSSDAVTGAMDTTDRWTSVYTNGKVTRNSAGNPHSWVVLKSPAIAGKTYYLLLDYVYTNDYQLTMVLGTTAPTGGSNTTAPTFTNSYTNTSVPFGLNGGWGPIHVHGSLATDGSFHILASRDNTGQFFSGFVGTLLTNTKGSDLTPFFVTIDADTNAMVTTGYGNGSYSFEVGWNNMRHPDDTGASSQYGVISPVISGSAPYPNLPAAPDIWDGSFPDFPLWVGSQTAGYKTLRGRIQDILFHGGSVPQSGYVDNFNAPTFMSVGRLWMPTNAIPIL